MAYSNLGTCGSPRYFFVQRELIFSVRYRFTSAVWQSARGWPELILADSINHRFPAETKNPRSLGLVPFAFFQSPVEQVTLETVQIDSVGREIQVGIAAIS